MKVYKDSLHLSIVTFNMLHRQPLANPTEDCAWIRDHFKPDIWGVQEAEGYTSVLKNVLGYGLAMVKNPHLWQRQDVILYNKRTMKLVSVGAHKMHGGKAHDYPPRYVYVAHFVDRFDGNSIYYYNTHVNQHIEVNGHPRHNNKQELATHHFEKMAAWIEARAKAPGSYVFWGGDLNVDEDADNKVSWKGFPNAIFKAHGMLSIWDELNVPAGSKDTSGNRKIDVIGSCNQDKGIKGLGVAVGPTSLHSDHNPVHAVYRIPRGLSSGGGEGSTPVDPSTGQTGDPSQLPVADVDADFPVEVPVPLPDSIAPVLQQPVGTWDHSVCCRKQT